MEISALTPAELITRNNSNGSALNGSAPLTLATTPDGMPDPISSPAAIVTINPVIEPSPVYREPLVVATYVRDKSHTGVAAQAATQALMSSLEQVKSGKTKFSVSSLFSQVAALSRETSEYRNEVRQFRVPAKVDVDKFSPDFSAAKGKRIESVFLNLRTKDGDSINIQFNRNDIRDGTATMGFSFVVDGELSEGEQKALAALMEKLGAMGDEFFRADTTQLRGLKDVDTQFIVGFNFTLQRFNPATDTYVEHSYEFSVDEVAQTQTLRAEDIKGYQVDITTQLQNLTGKPNLKLDVLQQYLDLIAQAGDESKAPNESKRFMLDAFSAMFGGFLTPVADDAQIDVDVTQQSIAAFDSGMPDFTASFRSPVYHNPGNYSQVAAMSLTLAQQTRTEQTGDSLLIKQDTRYDFSYSKFEGVANDSLDMLGANYTYVRERKTAETSRMLSMTGDRVNNLWVEQQVDKKVERETFENYKQVEREAYEYGDRRLQEYAELVERLNTNNRRRAINELLAASKEKLFLDI